jgi:hypothetical protein
MKLRSILSLALLGLLSWQAADRALGAEEKRLAVSGEYEIVN